MSDEAFDAALRDALEAADRGSPPTQSELRERHPGHDTTVDRAFAAYRDYRAFRSGVARHAPAVVELLAPGERLGDFEIVDHLASGGMGVVYRARQLSLGGRIVALKVLPFDRSDAHATRRFEREALAAAELHHAHLAEIHGFGEQRGMLFFAMRLVDGPTLKRVLDERARGGASDDPRVRRAIVERIAEVAEALAVVHAHGLVHRDVKPANIVLEDASDAARALTEGSAVLVDFGLVRPIGAGDVTLTGQSPATPGYAAPEQLLGREVDASADVFSLGVTLHDLLAAREPKTRLQASAGLEPIEQLAPDVDADLAAIVAKAVDHSAKWRHRDASALAADLRAWLEGRTVSARHPPLVERAQRWVRAHPRRVVKSLAGAVAVLLLVLGAAAVASFAAEAARARTAREQGDIAQLVRTLERVPAWLCWPLLRDGELVELAERARAHDERDPIVRVAARLQQNDTTQALLEAATHLRVNGLDSAPLASRWLIARLRADAERAPANAADPPHALRASLVIARLLYERPIEDSAAERAGAALRAELVASFDAPGFTRDDRLNLLTALAGCGRIDDAGWILAWAAQQPRYSEEQRMAFMCVESLVRRANAAGMTHEVPRAAIWRRIEPMALHLAAVEHEDALHYGWPAALRRLGTALALARPDRATNDRTPDALFGQVCAAITRQDALARWRTFLASARDARLPDLLASEPAHVLNAGRATEWGQACALYADRELTARARARMEAFDPAALAAFDHAFLDSLAELRGENASMRTDPETWLGAVHAPERFPPLELQRAGDEDPLVDARWSVGVAHTSLSGSATDCRVELARHETDGPSSGFVWLGVFGRSTLQLEFELPPGELPQDRFVRLWCQIGARPYYPFDGVAFVDVGLNAALLADTYSMHSANEGMYYDLDLPANRLLQGANALSLRLHEATTTTLRFHRAEIRRRAW